MRSGSPLYEASCVLALLRVFRLPKKNVAQNNEISSSRGNINCCVHAAEEHCKPTAVLPGNSSKGPNAFPSHFVKSSPSLGTRRATDPKAHGLMASVSPPTWIGRSRPPCTAVQTQLQKIQRLLGNSTDASRSQGKRLAEEGQHKRIGALKGRLRYQATPGVTQGLCFLRGGGGDTPPGDCIVSAAPPPAMAEEQLEQLAIKGQP